MTGPAPSGVAQIQGAGDALDVLRSVPGRAVLAEPDGALYLGRNYQVLRSRDDGRSWQPLFSFPRPAWRRAAEWSRLACRLVRQEVRALVRLPDGQYVGASREGVFQGREGQPVLDRARVEAGPLPLMPPMRLCAGPDGTVIFGEYGCPKEPRAVRLFASKDAGRSFEVAHTFEAGTILHVHNIVWDEGEGHYWVLVGDHGEHPGIGRLSADLRLFDWLAKGSQTYRAVHVFDLGDRLLYATDTEKETNHLVSLDKRTGRAERLRDFEGSCIYACRFGGILALTTSVEPSAVNPSQDATLWVSRDGEQWDCVWRARKDRWSPDWFQFGSIILPDGGSERETVFFSGQAVEGLDGRAVVARLGRR